MELRFGEATMGTHWSLTCLAAAEDEARLRPLLVAEMDAVIAEMSPWEKGAAIRQFNRLPAGEAMILPPRMAEVLTLALDVAADCGGAFSPAMAALTNAWGFGPANFTGFPSAHQQGHLARQAKAWDALEWDADAATLTQPGGVSLDFCGIAKGYAVDCIAPVLRGAGVLHFLAEIGGEFVGSGMQKNLAPWWVDTESPPDIALPALRISLSGMALATSGDFRRYHASASRRMSHTIDPRTGAPSDSDVVMVSVLHPQCAIADALATAIMVMGSEQGLAYADDRDLAVMVIRRDKCGEGGAMLYSRTMADWLVG